MEDVVGTADDVVVDSGSTAGAAGVAAVGVDAAAGTVVTLPGY